MAGVDWDADGNATGGGEASAQDPCLQDAKRPVKIVLILEQQGASRCDNGPAGPYQTGSALCAEEWCKGFRCVGQGRASVYSSGLVLGCRYELVRSPVTGTELVLPSGP